MILAPQVEIDLPAGPVLENQDRLRAVRLQRRLYRAGGRGARCVCEFSMIVPGSRGAFDRVLSARQLYPAKMPAPGMASLRRS